METCEALETFMSSRISSKNLSQGFFVILDEYTKGDKPTCQIAIDGRGIEDISEVQFSFRCDLASVHEASRPWSQSRQILHLQFAFEGMRP